MNATRVLVAQHQAIDALLDEVEHETRRHARARAVSRAAEELIAHMAGEEAVFYPAARRVMRLEDAEDEHLRLRVVLRRVLATRVSDAAFVEHLRALRDLFRQHVRVEESELLPAVERALSPVELEMLGAEVLASRPPIWIVTSEGAALMHADDPFLARTRVSLPIPPATGSTGE